MTLEDYDMFKQYHWKSSFYFRDGNMFVQHDVVMQWSSISGSRPGVRLPEDTSSDNAKS